MGVYIRGMEMPSSCWECHFGHGDTGVCVVDFRNHGDWNEPQDCPLIPVPPHGRLIDEDEFLNRAFGTGLFGEDDMRLLGELVDGSPTIIEAELPVHHGTFAAASEKEALKRIIPAEDSKLSATIKCGGAVTCKEYVDTAGNLRWTGTHSEEHIIPAEEGET